MVDHPVFFKDPWSAITHFAGFLAALVGLVLLLSWTLHDPAKVTAMAIYGGSLAFLFAASSAYHFLDGGPRVNRWLRRVDHAAIYLLIAGSYVPPLVHLLDGGWRVGMLLAIGAFTVLGLGLKLFWLDSPAWLSVGAYLAMGWVVVVPAHIIFPQLTPGQVVILVAGGLLYSLGAMVYLFERPDPWPEVFGHHEVWHLFVLGGAGAHFAFMLTLVDTAIPAG